MGARTIAQKPKGEVWRVLSRLERENYREFIVKSTKENKET